MLSGKDTISVMQNPGYNGGPIHPTAFGAILRDARLALGRSLQDAERQTRILARHLAALENGDFQLLPVGIYARGFVYNYANWLQLNPQEMVRLFNEARGETEAAYRPQPVGRPVNTSGPFSPNFVVIIFAILVLSGVAAWGYSLVVQKPPKKQIIDIPTVPATPTAFPGGTNAPLIVPSRATGGIIIPSTTSGTATGTDTAIVTTSTTTATATATPATSLKIVLTASDKVYYEVYIDGDKTAKFKGFLSAGDTQDIDAKQSVTVIIGKPGSVTYSVNGQDKGRFPPEALRGYTIKP